MLSRAITRNTFKIGRRFQSSGAGSSPSKDTFTNKYNFNTNPPPIHEYWNLRNASVLFAFVPIYVAVGYLTKSTSSGIVGYEGLLGFADGDKSPMKELKFSEPQTSST